MWKQFYNRAHPQSEDFFLARMDVGSLAPRDRARLSRVTLERRRGSVRSARCEDLSTPPSQNRLNRHDHAELKTQKIENW